MRHNNNSFLARLGIILHDCFPADIFEQFIVFAFTLVLAGSFSRAFASIHLYSSNTFQPSINQEQPMPTAR